VSSGLVPEGSRSCDRGRRCRDRRSARRARPGINQSRKFENVGTVRSRDEKRVGIAVRSTREARGASRARWNWIRGNACRDGKRRAREETRSESRLRTEVVAHVARPSNAENGQITAQVTRMTQLAPLQTWLQHLAWDLRRDHAESRCTVSDEPRANPDGWRAQRLCRGPGEGDQLVIRFDNRQSELRAQSSEGGVRHLRYRRASPLFSLLAFRRQRRLIFCDRKP
jgi:hypothetical protein